MAKITSTGALRPVCRAVNEALGEVPKGAFNFGLYYNKWLHVVDRSEINDDWKRSANWACTTSDETDVKKRLDFCVPNTLLDNLPVTIGLFNGSRDYTRKKPEVVKKDDREHINEVLRKVPISGNWDGRAATLELSRRHDRIGAVCLSFEKLGYRVKMFTLPLISPLTLGLGDEHPSEKGFRFDWTLGVPFVPASSVKGVVRLAYLVNMLNSLAASNPNDDKSLDKFCKNIEKEETQPEEVKNLFGFTGDKDGKRGKVVFLDAYPARLPRLKAEIMNCHYPDYLTPGDGGRRGPTEDQNPNPQKYLAVDPILSNGKHLEFEFIMLVSGEIGDDLTKSLEKAFLDALSVHGLGAKTAVGHGRFGNILQSVGQAGRETGQSTGPVIEQPRPGSPKTQVWRHATLAYDRGRAKYTLQMREPGKSVKKVPDVPEGLVPDRLRAKAKKGNGLSVIATVEQMGQMFKVIKIE
jgi:CRISPR-associated protein Cmr6